MATTLGLPEGFELENSNTELTNAQHIVDIFDPADPDLPEGFELEDMSNEMTSPELQKDMQQADEVAVTKEKPSTFRKVWESLKTTNPNEPVISKNVGSNILEGIKTETKEGFKQAVSNPFDRPKVELDKELAKDYPELAYTKAFVQGASQPFENFLGAARAGWSFIGEPIKELISKPLERVTGGAIPSGVTDIGMGIALPAGGILKTTSELRKAKEALKPLSSSEKTVKELQDLGYDVSGLGTKSAQEATEKNIQVAEALGGTPSGTSKIQEAVTIQQLSEPQKDALANLAITASNPFRIMVDEATAMSPEAAKIKMAELERELDFGPASIKRADEIKAEIDQLADIAIGNNPLKDQIPKELLNEKFQTNIAEPISKNVELGVPLPNIQEELINSLTRSKQFQPEEIDDIVEAALAPYVEVKIPTEQLKNIPLTPAPTPKKEPSLLGKLFGEDKENKNLLTAEEVTKIVESPTVKGIKTLADDFVYQQRWSRAFSKKNNKIYGEGELTAKDTRLAKIAASREVNNNVFTSYIDGGADGRVYDFINGIQVPNYTVKPLTHIYDTASKGGLAQDQANELIKAANAKSNWQRIDKEVIAKQQELDDLKNLIKGAKTESERALLRNKLKTANKEMKDIASKATYMSRDEADKLVNSLGKSKAGDEFLTEMKKWTDSMLDMSVRGGLIKESDAAAMKAANKYYLPEMRFVEDFGTSEGLALAPTKGTTTGVGKRDFSSKEFNVNPIENLVTKLASIEHAALRNEERVHTLYWNLEHMDNAAFEVIYQQPKDKVLEAIAKIKAGKAQKVIDGRELVNIPKGEIASPTNFSLYIDGHRLDLTIKNQAYRDALLRPRIYKAKGKLEKASQKFAFLTRNSLTTWNPIFQPSASIRGALGYRANIPADLRGKIGEGTRVGFSKVAKKIFTEPEYYNKLKANISPGVLNRGLKNISKNELIEETIQKISKPEAKGFLPAIKRGIVRTGHGLEEWAEFNEMLIRGRAYEETKATLSKLNYAPDDIERIAIRTAKNLETNYFAHGSGNPGYDFVLNATPFLRTRINGSIKAINSGIYRPKEVAKGIASYAALIHATNIYNRQFTDEDGVPFVDKLDPNLRANYWHMYLPGATSINDRIQLQAPFNIIRVGNATEMWADKAMKQVAHAIYDNVEPAIQESLKDNPAFAGYLQENGLEAQDVFAITMDLMLKDFDPYAFQSMAGLGTLTEVATNTDSFGGPIVPEFMKEYDPYLQVVPGKASPAVVAVTNYLADKGITVANPTLLTYMVQDIAGNVGGLMLDGADSIYSVLGETEMPAREAGSIPGVKRFTGYTSEIPQEGIGGMYSNMYRDIKPIYTNYTRLKAESQKSADAMDRFLKYENEHAEELNAYNEIFKPTNDALKPLYEELARLSGATGEQYPTDVTPEKEITGDPVKREKYNNIRKDIIDIQRGAIDEMYERRDVLGETWTKRLRQGPVPRGATVPFLGNIGEKPVDKQEDSWYNFDFSLISSANAAEVDNNEVPEGISLGMEEDVTGPLETMDALPPGFEIETAALHREAPDLGEDYTSGFFETNFPNIRKNVVNNYKNLIVNRTLDLEGGYVNNPRDNGGATNHGVTLNTLRLVEPDATVEDIKNLTQDEARRIYTKIFWDDAKVDKVPIPLQDLVFDGNINHGVPGMTKVIQRALNDLGAKVKVDGKLGNNTLNALNAYDAEVLREAILNRRKRLYEQHEDFDEFGEGWMNRLSEIKDIPKEAMEA